MRQTSVGGCLLGKSEWEKGGRGDWPLGSRVAEERRRGGGGDGKEGGEERRERGGR